MPQFVNSFVEKEKLNISDICSNFDCLKVSVMQKASRISRNLDQVATNPDSNLSLENSYENSENEKNSCNLPQADKNSQKSKSTRSGLNFSIKKILHENEMQRREIVWQKMQIRRQEMEKQAQAMKKDAENYQSIWALKREQQKIEELAQLVAEEEKQAQQSEIRRKHEEQLLAQRRLEQKEKFERDAEEERRKIKEREESMKEFQLSFQERWREFESLTHSCKNDYASGPYIEKFNEFVAHMEIIGNSARSGNLTAEDVEVSKMIVEDCDEVIRLFKLEIERIEEMHNASIAQREYELRQAEIAQLQEQNLQVRNEIEQAQAPVDVQGSEVTDSANLESQETNLEILDVTSKSEENPPVLELYRLVDKESLKLYVASQNMLMDFEARCKDLLDRNDTKTFRFKCQKDINIPVNAISSISREHLMEKYQKLTNVLSENFLDDPRADAFCKNTLAKKIVSQGEALVSSKPEMAFAIAAVVVALWNDNQELGELILANFRVTCPFIVPAFFPRREGQTNEEYYRSLGYKYTDGTVEKQDQFLKRISGIVRLYASIIVTSQRQGVTQSHPHGLANAWRWFAAMLNNDPRPEMLDVCATLMLDMLEVTGSSLWAAYPKQFPKLLSTMITEYYPLMGRIGGIGGGPMTRLEAFLKQCLLSGCIAPPEGLLPPHFW